MVTLLILQLYLCRTRSALAARRARMASELNLAPTLSSYRDYRAEAHELVKNLIRSSLEKIAAEQEAQRAADESATNCGGSIKEPMNWPLGKDFTVEKGLEAIDKFVKVCRLVLCVEYTSIWYRSSKFLPLFFNDVMDVSIMYVDSQGICPQRGGFSHLFNFVCLNSTTIIFPSLSYILLIANYE